MGELQARAVALSGMGAMHEKLANSGLAISLRVLQRATSQTVMEPSATVSEVLEEHGLPLYDLGTRPPS